MKKISIREIISKIFIIIAICLLCYPAFAEIYNKYHSSHVIESYQDLVNEIDEETYGKLIEEAKKYNENLINDNSRFFLSDSKKEEYMSLLDVNGSGVMGVISIPKINVRLPIYHTTDDDVLQVAIGHIPGTSLPIGGEGTHSVLSGHRGLASASLFTNLPELQLGDNFNIEVLNEVLTYEVDKIEVVLPSQIQNIGIEDGKDYCTLVTCTPLGINSHRLLVRGHRVETIYETKDTNYNIINDIIKGNVLTLYEVIMLIIALIFFIFGFIYPFIKRILKLRKRKEEVENEKINK